MHTNTHTPDVCACVYMYTAPNTVASLLNYIRSHQQHSSYAHIQHNAFVHSLLVGRGDLGAGEESREIRSSLNETNYPVCPVMESLPATAREDKYHFRTLVITQLSD